MRLGLKSVAWVFLLSASTLAASAQAPDNTKSEPGRWAEGGSHCRQTELEFFRLGRNQTDPQLHC